MDDEIALQHDKGKDEEAYPLYGQLNLDVYTPKDLADRLRINKQTILNEIIKGNLRSKNFKGPAGHRITREEVIRWLTSDD